MTAALEDDTEPCEATGREKLPRPFHEQSYAHLLEFPVIPDSTENALSDNQDITTPVIDAIIVPTIRSPEQISSAAELAGRAKCRLVVLYTDSFPAGLSSVLSKLKPGAATPLALRHGLKSHLLDLAADLPQGLVSPGALDISRKRNLGLLIGRSIGWTRMLFLDDDIRKLNVAKLSSAAALLGRYPVVGLRVNKYPDASVVGHARRLAGRRQEPFISGGSLLVDPQRVDSFFPPIYHEDWLCIINHLSRGEVAIGGAVGQQPYQPFTNPERARHEEFGDILASGLLWLVHTRHKTSAAEPVSRDSAVAGRSYWSAATETRFWAEILSQRATLLDSISARLKRLNLPEPSPFPSLMAAQQRCAELAADEFVSFTKRWVDNLALWQESLPYLPQVGSVEKALAGLGLSHAVRTHEADSQQAQARGPRWTGGFAGRWGRRASTDGRHRFGWRSVG